MFLKHNHYAWVIALSCAGILFAFSLAIYTFGVFLRPLSLEFGWGRGALSLAPAIAAVVGGTLSVVTGKLSDRYGPRILITLGGIMLGTGFLLMAQVRSLSHVYLLWGICIGLSFGCLVIPIMSTIPGWFARRKGLAVGIATVGFGTGALVMPLLAQTLISAYGWRTSFLILGIIAWAIIIPLSQLVRHAPAQMERSSEGQCENVVDRTVKYSDKGLSLGQAMRTFPFWVYGMSHLLWAVCSQAIVVHIVPLAIDSGISDISAAGILSFMVGISLFGRVSVGLVSDKLGSRRALSLCLLAVMLALWWLLFAHEIWAFFLWAILFGLADGGKVTSETLVPLDLFGTKSLGVILGVLMFCGTIGGAIGPPLAGYIFDITGSYDLALLTLAAVGTIAAILGLVLLRYKDQGGKDSKLALGNTDRPSV